MTVYFDGVHLMSPDLVELHAFAESCGIKRCWFGGVRKEHPHYDVTSPKLKDKVLSQGAIMVETRELVKLYRKWYAI